MAKRIQIRFSDVRADLLKYAEDSQDETMLDALQTPLKLVTKSVVEQRMASDLSFDKTDDPPVQKP